MNEVQRPLEVIAAEINFYKAQTATGIIEIGKRLIEAKAQLQHGEWGTWLQEKVEFSSVTAQRFMRVANEISNTSALKDLSQTKVFMLLDVPQDQREEFIQSNPVEDMTTRELQQAIKEKKDLERQIKELENRKPEIIEKEVIKAPDDYEYYKNAAGKLQNQVTRLKHDLEDKDLVLQGLKGEKELLERKAKLNDDDANKYKELKGQIEKLSQTKDELGRQIKARTELSGLVVRVEHMLKTELAPVKYSRAIHEASTDEIVTNNLHDIIDRVQGWCDEMRRYLPMEIYTKGDGYGTYTE